MNIKTYSYSLILMLVFMLILVPTTYAQENRSHGLLYIENVTIELENGNANVSMDYKLGIFARFYIYMMGGRVIESELQSVLVDYEDITTEEINEERAVFVVRDVVHSEGDRRVFGSSKLSQEVGNVTIKFVDGGKMKFSDVEVIPRITYRE
ncbi:MAG: hypothetical protein SVY15_02500 [Halobacteriota archaeon]|nr:hypothetical protein [Halobacteriota archaeon]